jgi:O-antigen/teichoic acid export membrane protein
VKKLLTVTLFSGLLTLLRMASGFLIAKVVAVYTGPSGMAMLGQVQGLVIALSGIVAAPCGNGVVRYTAENSANGFDACAPWWRASVKWMLLLLVVIIPFSLIFAEKITFWLLSDVQYVWLIWLVSLMLPFSVLNTLIASVLNGQQQYRRYVLLGMISVLIATVFMYAMILSYNLKGALAAAAVFSAISGMVMLLGSLNEPWLKLKYWWGSAAPLQLKGIGGYVAMAMTSALSVPISLILVRNILIDQVGWAQAGHWQAVWKISEVYLGVITIALSTYFLPKLSNLHDRNKIMREIKNTALIIMPIVIFLAILVYFFRDVAILVLFTDDFKSARDLFKVQLIGDVVKVFSFLFAYPLISRGEVKLFMGTEVVFSITFVLFSYLLINKYGVQGANFAYLLNYLIYLIVVWFVLKKVMVFKS